MKKQNPKIKLYYAGSGSSSYLVVGNEKETLQQTKERFAKAFEFQPEDELNFIEVLQPETKVFRIECSFTI